MNTYAKYAPNVYVAKCTEKHEKFETIEVETKYGKLNESIVFNLVAEKDGFYYYSIIRADGFNCQEWAKKRLERIETASINASKKADAYYVASNKDRAFLSLGEPIKIGHHSESRHRKIIDQAHNNFGKFIEFDKKACEYSERCRHYELKSTVINESMPESVEYFEYKLEKATERHLGLKNGSIPIEHNYSITYAKKEVNELTKKLEICKKLWE